MWSRVWHVVNLTPGGNAADYLAARIARETLEEAGSMLSGAHVPIEPNWRFLSVTLSLASNAAGATIPTRRYSDTSHLPQAILARRIMATRRPVLFEWLGYVASRDRGTPSARSLVG